MNAQEPFEFPCKWCGEALRVVGDIIQFHQCDIYHTANEHFAYVCKQIRIHEGWPSPEERLAEMRVMAAEAIKAAGINEVTAHIENADPLLGKYMGGPWKGSPESLVPGRWIEHNGRIGTITGVDNISPAGTPVVLVSWDGSHHG